MRIGIHTGNLLIILKEKFMEELSALKSLGMTFMDKTCQLQTKWNQMES